MNANILGFIPSKEKSLHNMVGIEKKIVFPTYAIIPEIKIETVANLQLFQN